MKVLDKEVLDKVCYTIEQKATGRLLDGNEQGAMYSYEYLNGGDYQKWAFEALNDGYYRIKQKATGRVLDGNVQGNIYSLNWNGGDYQRWALKALDDGYYRIEQKATGRVLDGNAQAHLYSSKWDGNENHYIEWKLEIADIKWDAIEEDIVYDQTEPPSGTRPVDIISKKVWKNDSPAEISETITHSITKKSTFEWSLKQTLKAGVKTELSVSAPLLASAKTEVSFEMGLEKNQTRSATVSETYEVSQTITLGKRSAIEVHAVMDWADDFKSPFTLYMWVSAKAATIDGSDYLLSSDRLKELLIEDKFAGTIISDGMPNRLLVGIEGEFVGSYGMNTRVETREIPINQALHDAVAL